jgi:trigger factor
MQIKTENEKSRIIVKMSFDKAEWDKAVNEVYKKNGEKYKVKGFRSGKVPRKIIEQQYGAEVFVEDAVHKLFTETFEKYLSDNPKIHIADYPHLDFGMSDDGGINMVATCDTDPKVTLGAYTGLEIKKNEIKISETDIDEYIAHIRESRAKQIAADKDYKIADGDLAVIDFAGSIDGKYFDGGTAKNFELEIGSHSFVDNFEEQLIGHKIGDSKDVKVKFPEDYRAKEYAGKQAKFEVTINNILRKELPAIDDNFAKEVSEFDNLSDYKSDIKKQMTEKADAQSKLINEDKLFDKVSENAKVEVPDKMVEQQCEVLMEELEHSLSHQGATLEMYAKYLNKTPEQLREDSKAAAYKQVKMRLVVDAIVDKENLYDKDRPNQFKKVQEFLSKNNKFV